MWLVFFTALVMVSDWIPLFLGFLCPSGHLPSRLEEFQPVPCCHLVLRECLLLCREYWLAGTVYGWGSEGDCVQKRRHHATGGTLVSLGSGTGEGCSPALMQSVIQTTTAAKVKCRVLTLGAMGWCFHLNLSMSKVHRDTLMCHHLCHRLLLAHVWSYLVCHAHLRLAHVLQGPGHDTPTTDRKDLLLPSGHLVHPICSYCGHIGYCRGITNYKILIEIK